MSRTLCAMVAALLTLVILNGCDNPPSASSASPLRDYSEDPVERGRYLARAGDCIACHTRQGESQFSGSRAVSTPFGTIYSSNLTSDKATGLGDWSADEFWMALHEGKSRDGRSLYPAFPYPNYSMVTREDSDALFAYLQTIEPVEQTVPPHELRFPYNTQLALNIWRKLFFRPTVYEVDEDQSQAWNRGSYLVRGLGHCSACHTPRGLLGNLNSKRELAGAYVESLGWEALPLTRGVLSEDDQEELVDLLKNGINQRDVMSGPMAEVVLHSLQYLRRDDLVAMASYLSTLPVATTPDRRHIRVGQVASMSLRQEGEQIYREHCVDCHGAQGQGESGRYPALAGNRGVTAGSPSNAIRMLMYGGFGASTQARPQPYGMPAYAHQLEDWEAAAVLSYIRGAWGNSASAVSPQSIRQD